MNDDDLMAGLDDDDNIDDDDEHHRHHSGEDSKNDSKYDNHIDDDDNDGGGDKKQRDMRHDNSVTMPISITPAAASTAPSSARYSLENEKDEMMKMTTSYSLPSSYDARFSTTATVDHEEDRRQREQDLKEMYIASQKQWNADTKSVAYEEDEEVSSSSSSCDESVGGEHGTDPFAGKNDGEDMVTMAAMQKQRQRSVSDHNYHDFEMRQRNDGSTDRDKKERKETDGHGLLDFWKTADFSIKKGQGNTAADALPEERQRSNSTGKLKDLWQRWFSSPSSSSSSPPCEQQQQQHDGDGSDHQSFSSLQQQQREREETRDFVNQIRKLNVQTINENNRRKEMAIALGDSDTENPKSEFRKMELITREIEEQVTRLEDASTQEQQQQQQQHHHHQRGYRSSVD